MLFEVEKVIVDYEGVVGKSVVTGDVKAFICPLRSKFESYDLCNVSCPYCHIDLDTQKLYMCNNIIYLFKEYFFEE